MIYGYTFHRPTETKVGNRSRNQGGVVFAAVMAGQARSSCRLLEKFFVVPVRGILPEPVVRWCHPTLFLWDHRLGCGRRTIGTVIGRPTEPR